MISVVENFSSESTMANIIRLKQWRTYLGDGRSSVTYGMETKGQVGVFIQVGSEPSKITSDDEVCDVDDAILQMAKTITKARRKKRGSKK